jgi:chromosomal replication initiation ATPase DnaA
MEMIPAHVYPIIRHSLVNRNKYPYVRTGKLPSKEDVIDVICKEFNTTDEFTKLGCRKYKYVLCRKLFFKILVFELNYRKVEVGRQYNCDHTTVIHAVKTFHDVFDTDESFREKVMNVYNHLNFKFS